MVFEMQIWDGVAVRACMRVCVIRCCAVYILFMFDLRPLVYLTRPANSPESIE